MCKIDGTAADGGDFWGLVVLFAIANLVSMLEVLYPADVRCDSENLKLSVSAVSFLFC